MRSAHPIREHMEVVGADGVHVGIVDHMEGPGRIKLAKRDPLAKGSHHYVPLDWVDYVDDHIHLNKNSSELMAMWKHN